MSACDTPVHSSGSFGELALLYLVPRAATVVAKDTRFSRMDWMIFPEVLAGLIFALECLRLAISG